MSKKGRLVSGLFLYNFDGYYTGCLLADLLQAKRDYYGAFTYGRVEINAVTSHTDWIGHGSVVESTTCEA